LKLRAPDCKGR
jgi:integrase